MHTPLRTLRARAAEIPGVEPKFSQAELTCRATILRAGRTLMAEEGRSAFTLARFASMIWISAATIRRHFIDLDSLLFDILMEHLQALSTALGRVRQDAPDRAAACRKAYLAHTRTGLGGLTEAHRLFTRDRCLLPRDDREALDQIQLGLGTLLGGECPASTLQLLDSEILEPEEVEAIIAHRHARAAQYLAENQTALQTQEAAFEAQPPKAPAAPLLAAGCPEPPVLEARLPMAPLAEAPLPEAAPAKAPALGTQRPPAPLPKAATAEAIIANPPAEPCIDPGPEPDSREDEPDSREDQYHATPAEPCIDHEPLPATLPNDPAEAVAACLAIIPKLWPPSSQHRHAAPYPPGQPPTLEPNPFPSLYERVLQSLPGSSPPG